MARYTSKTLGVSFVSSNEKIALFLPSLMGGGAEKVMINLAGGLLDLGKEVHMVLSQATGEYMDRVPRRVKVVDLQSRRTLFSLPGLVRYLRRERPNVLVSAVEHANVIAVWGRMLAAVPTRSVVTIHTNLRSASQQVDHRTRVQVMPFLIRRTYPLADEIVAVSQGVAEDFAVFAGMPVERIRVIYNPVVTPEIYDLAGLPAPHPWFQDGGAPVILSIGRLSDQKDFPTLFRAFVRLRREGRARLLVLGDGDQRPYLEKLAADLGISDVVSMPGFVDNPYPYLAKASVLVLSSRAEGLPTVLIEAMALGTPIVSSNCRSGPDEILEGGKWGRLVPVGDENAMAQALLDALDDRRRRPTAQGVSRFTLQSAVAQYVEAFQDASPRRQEA